MASTEVASDKRKREAASDSDTPAPAAKAPRANRRKFDKGWELPAPKRGAKALSTAAKLNVQKSPFLRLPSEVRNRIYEYLFGDKAQPGRYHVDSIKLITFDETSKSLKKKMLKETQDPHCSESEDGHLKPPQLLYVCRQLFHETASHSQKIVTGLSFDHVETFMKFQRANMMSLDHRRLVRVLYLDGPDWPLRNRSLRHFRGVKTIVWTYWIDGGVNSHGRKKERPVLSRQDLEDNSIWYLMGNGNDRYWVPAEDLRKELKCTPIHTTDPVKCARKKELMEQTGAIFAMDINGQSKYSLPSDWLPKDV